MEGAVGVFPCRRKEEGGLQKAFCLLLKGAHDFRQGYAILVLGCCGIAANVAYGLNMQGPHVGDMGEGKAKKRSQIVHVHAWHKGDGKDYPYACPCAVRDCGKLDVQQLFPSYGTVDFVSCPVELQKGAVKTCVLQSSSVAWLLSQA